MLLTANAETGTNGVQLAGGGDFDIVGNGTTGSTIYDNSVALKGNLAYKTTSGSGNTYVAWSTALGGTKTQLWMRMYAVVSSYPSVGSGLFHFRSGGALAGKIGMTSVGKINVSSGANTILQTSTTTIATGSMFRIEVHGIASASPTGGTLEVRIFASPETATPTEVLGPFASTQTATNFDQVWFGPVGAGSGPVLFYDEVAISDTGWVGPSGAATVAPAATSNPSIPTGTTKVGSVLLASNTGTWTGTPSPTYSYQWRRCDSSGANATPISGATGQSYTLVSADLGSTIRIAVTGTNTAGSATTASAQTAVVTAGTGTSNTLMNNLDGADGAAVTTASTAATGDSLTDIVISSGGSLLFDATNASHTGAAVKATAGGVSAYAGWSNTSYGPVTQAYARIYVRFTSYPASGAGILRFRLGASTVVSINITNSGQLRIRDASGAALASGASIIPLGAWVRVEAYVNASSTAGQASYRLYVQKDSITPSETLSTATNLSLPNTTDGIQFGLSGNATAGDVMWFDEVGIDTDWIGPAQDDLAPRWGWGIVAKPGLAAVVTPPVNPGVTTTIFGYNPNSPEGNYFATYFGKTPMARCYNGTRGLPSNGSDFQPGGFAYNAANVGQAGHVSSKRINMSVIYDPSTVVNSSSALAVQMRNYAASVPSDWYVQVVLYHEYNLHTTDLGGDGSTGRTTAQFVDSFPILANAIATGDAGNGRCIAVINPSYGNGSFQNQMVPNASLMPAGSQLHFDVYNNPSGNPSGYKAYGCKYRTAAQIMTPVYNAVTQLGYANTTYGWGIDEFGAPRRVAPALTTLNTSLGWGPQSPHDIDGSGMAAAITDFGSWVLNAPVQPTTVIFFTGQGSWNQSVKTAGTADKDDGTAGSPGPNYQGFPITVDPTKPMNAYKAFTDISA